MARTSLAMREQLAHTLLQLHFYAHSYLPTASLHGPLYEVYTRQVLTIGGATMHRMAIAPPKILKLGSYGGALHARTRPVAAHGLPRGGGGVPRILAQPLTQILGGI